MKDLREQLTVAFIDTKTDPNALAAIKALEKQTCQFVLIKIECFYPMSRAFQEMFDRCNTKFLIQIDSDMVMNSNAIEEMFNEFEGHKAPENIVMDCYLLRDVHLDFKIYGVKIYNMEIFKKYPFNLKNPSCEVEQLKRMKLDGYDIRFKSKVLGEHSPHWNNETIFERYYNLIQKFRLFRYTWLEELPKKLVNLIKKNPSDLNIYAFAGVLAGIYSDTVIEEEKDFRKKRKEYGRLKGFLEPPHQVTLYMTSNCNFNCTFCFRQHDKIEQAPDMTAEIVEIMLCKYPNIKGICICGFGEPLSSPNLIPVLQKLKSANKLVGLISNGSLINKRFNELNGWYKPNYISVSLNAHTAEEHEKITRTKTWDEVISGIKRVVNSPIECFVSSVVTLENVKYVPEFLKLVKSLGVKTVHLHNLLPHFSTNGNDEYFWNNVLQTEHQNLINDIKNLPESDIVKGYPILIDKSGGKNKCNFAWYSFSVNGLGNLSVCYDNKTEILTNEGWKFFKDLHGKELVYNLDFKNQKTILSPIYEIINKKYNGIMHKYKNKNLDLVITPEHGLWGELIHDFHIGRGGKKYLSKSKGFQIIKSEDLTKSHYLKVPSVFYNNNKSDEYINIKGFTYNYTGKNQFIRFNASRGFPDIKINFNDWAEFLGWYLSEGCLYTVNKSKNRGIQISQKKNIKELEQLLNRMPFIWNKYKHKLTNSWRYCIINPTLATHIAKECGQTTKKRVPQYIKSASVRVISSFLKSYILRDGCKDKKQNRISIVTTVKQLADDLQELIIKEGKYWSSINEYPETKWNIRGQSGISKKRYIVSLLFTKIKDISKKNQRKMFKEIDYNDTIYCVNSKTGIILVRRNGNPIWCGNCNSVLPCNKKYGNINDHVVWNNNALQKFRDDFCDGNLPHCKTCFRNFNMGF